MSGVGSIKDQFWWDNVKIEEGSSSSNPRWRCNHCWEEYSGSAEMIRDHLAGYGTVIASCPKVDPDIRELAIMEIAELPNSSAAPFQASSSMVNVGANHDETWGTATADGDEEFMNFDFRDFLPYYDPSSYSSETLGKGRKVALSDFCWDNMETLPGRTPNPIWRCKHCRSEFSGTPVEEIRKHLSGEGADISPCENVPIRIRMEALNRRPRKRARFSQFSKIMKKDGKEIVLDDTHSSNSASTKEEREEIVLDTLVEFLLRRNVSVDTLMDWDFSDFLKMTAQHDRVPLWLDDPNVIQRLLYGYYEHMTEAYILEVKESWEISGCTYIFYNLNEEGQKVSCTLGEENFVVGWYSPKGFFFTQENDFDNLSHECGPGGATQYISHRVMSKCHYQSFDLTCYKESPSMWCVQDRIQRFCRDICKTNWAKDLIEKSKKIYTYMMLSSSSRGWIQEEFTENHRHHTMFGSSFMLLVTIMNLKGELKTWLSDVTQDGRKTLEECGDCDTEIITIIDSDEFWVEGGKLQGVQTSLIKIYDIVDNFALPAGYLHIIINREKEKIEGACDPTVSKYRMFWECFEEYFGNPTREKESAFTYLSRACISAKPEGDLNLSHAGKDALQRMVRREQREALDAELEACSNRSTNPFAKLPYVDHPTTDGIQLWERYGGRFPLLKKCAMKLLNQPVSCLCNQVKKHMSEIQGTDNLVLRLNYKMMTEFKKKRRFSLREYLKTVKQYQLN